MAVDRLICPYCSGTRFSVALGDDGVRYICACGATCVVDAWGDEDWEEAEGDDAE